MHFEMRLISNLKKKSLIFHGGRGQGGIWVEKLMFFLSHRRVRNGLVWPKGHAQWPNHAPKCRKGAWGHPNGAWETAVGAPRAAALAPGAPPRPLGPPGVRTTGRWLPGVPCRFGLISLDPTPNFDAVLCGIYSPRNSAWRIRADCILKCV